MEHERQILRRDRQWPWAGLALALLLGGPGCDDEETPVVTYAAVEQIATIPPKPQLDILLVIDDSPSMCEEQASLSKNLRAFGELLLDSVSRRRDIRLAVVSADAANPSEAGRFLYRPAAPDAFDGCPLADAFDTADCPANADPILRFAEISAQCPAGDSDCQRAAVERGIRCRVTLGLGGSGHEAGLEASRRALSCDGPNAAALGACCENGRPVPNCDIPRQNPQPDFLRPGADLEVIFISDEDDCSTADLRPPTAAEGIADHPGPGAEAFGQSLCTWQRQQLEPVSTYADFLIGLKARPGEQLYVAALTGQRAYTEQGDFITYSPQMTPAQAGCLDETGAYDPGRACNEDTDCPGTENTCRADPVANGATFCTGEGAEAICCPDGQCVGAVLSACESEGARSNIGERYLELAEIFDRAFSAGVGCPPGSENDPTACLSICFGDYGSVLAAIVARGIASPGFSACLDAMPACQVDDGKDQRPCSTEAERNNTANYSIQVRNRCHQPAAEDGGCDPRNLTDFSQPNAWFLYLDDDACSVGARIELTDDPQPDSDVIISYQVVTPPR